MAGVLFSLAVLAFWIYSLFDVITTPDEESRNLPKVLWVLVVVLVPVVGGLFWMLLGRPQAAGSAPRPRPRRRPQHPPAVPPKGPDDDPDFLKDLERRMREED